MPVPRFWSLFPKSRASQSSRPAHFLPPASRTRQPFLGRFRSALHLAERIRTSASSRLQANKRVRRLLQLTRAPRDPNRKTRLHYLLRRFSRPSAAQLHARDWVNFILAQSRQQVFLQGHLQARARPVLPPPQALIMNISRDVVVCRGADGTLHCTDFHVAFKPVSGFYRWLVGRCYSQQRASSPKPTAAASAAGAGEGDPQQGTLGKGEEVVELELDEYVEVQVNGTLVPELQMVMTAQGECVFRSTGEVRPSQQGVAAMPLQHGPNEIVFTYKTPFGHAPSTKAWVHLWDVDDHVVVSDIDGTITKSDVIGYIDTVQLGKYDYTHEGICRLYSHLHGQHKLRFMYLTSRPISMLTATRAYIAGCEQEGHRLPHGPIFTSMETLATVLYKELIDKSIRFFKAHTLLDVASVFTRAGRDPAKAVFLFGFGNKPADGQAYSAAGLHPENIFIIDPNSDILIFGEGGAARKPPLEKKEPAQKQLEQQQQQQQEQQQQQQPQEEEARRQQQPAEAQALAQLSPFLSYSDARLLEVLIARMRSRGHSHGLPGEVREVHV